MYIKEKLNAFSVIHSNFSYDMAIGSSGTIVAAASIIAFRRTGKFKKSLNGFSFSTNEVFDLTSDVLKCKSPVDRLFIEGMEIKRADIIPTGLLILSEIFRTLKLKNMTVSENALREGIIIDTIAKLEVMNSMIV